MPISKRFRIDSSTPPSLRCSRPEEVRALPVLPLVDLLILMGTASLGVRFVLKAVALTTLYRPSILGFSSADFVLITGVCFGFALVLIARTWLKLNEPGLLSLQNRMRVEQAALRAEEIERAHAAPRVSDAANAGTQAR